MGVDPRDWGYLIFTLAITILVNFGVFVMEAIQPASAEHWQVGVALLGFGFVSYLWNRYSRSYVKEFMIVISFINGVLAILLDVVYWVLT
jgi:hypothetical protein